MNNYFKELPEDYVIDKVIDAKEDTKVKIFFVLGSFVIMVLVFSCFLPYLINNFKLEDYENTNLLVIYLLLIGGMLLYVVLHELTHGLFYKIFTKEKLTYGFTLTVAYCGVPNLYLKKIPALIAALAPFTIFSIVFGIGLLLVKDYWYFATLAFIFSVHVSGCIGDLYVSILMIFKYKGKDILVNDTGPKQTFYIRNS